MNFEALSLPAGLYIRPSQAKDESFLIELYKSTRNDLDLIDGDTEFIEELKLSQYQAQTASYEEQFPNSMSFIVEYHEQKIGRVILDFGSTEILIVDISFITEARGKGLGSGVMKSFIHCSEQTGIPLTLSVRNDNVNARAFYTKLGFTHLQHIDTREYLSYYPQTCSIRVNA